MPLQPQPTPRMSSDAALDVLARRRTDQVTVATMTALAPWRERSPSARNLVCLGFMGGASAFALGVALARPDVPVWVLDGDGSLLMQLGSLATIAHAAPQRFLHVVFHNSVYETSGEQPIPAEGKLSFTALARAAGYAHAVRFDDLESFDAALDDLLAQDGPLLLELMTRPSGRLFQPPPPSAAPSAPVLARNWPPARDSLAADPPAAPAPRA